MPCRYLTVDALMFFSTYPIKRAYMGEGLFELYFEQNADKSRQRKEKYEEYSLAFALSQMF